MRTVVVLLAFIAACAAAYGGAYAIGRATADPRDTAAYHELARQVGDAKRSADSNRDTSKKLVSELKDLRRQEEQARRSNRSDEDAYRRYVPDDAAADGTLAMESFDVGQGITPGDPFMRPRIVLRNRTGHVVTDITVEYVIVGDDGAVLEDDVTEGASNIRVYPGRAVAVDDLTLTDGHDGALLKPVKYRYRTAQADSSYTEKEFPADMPTKVIP
ncbi:hypothetical protein [Bifidobacterium platyrrhinorum]|uniref:hypothetical protein n=1 Tax=Bifidobacterium platyrrhinorum TaxID=2661628 RepID=UPI0013D15D65|nr:hypothetical protein [Bifidobacterium platyrrhinorum]